MDSFGLRSDAALCAVAEIVHDIDYNEASFDRPETADVQHALEQLYTADTSDDTSDEERLEHGAVLFESLC